MNDGSNETTPDELMAHFKGRSLKSIIVFTVVVHAVVLLGTSVSYLAKTVLGEDSSKLSEKERVEKAVREATASLREIAEEHGLNPQDISSQFSSGAKAKASVAGPQPEKAVGPEPGPVVEPVEPKSEIEKEINVKAKGPELPSLDEEEDLFK